MQGCVTDASIMDEKGFSHLMISAYSRSFPLLSLHLRYMTEASTLAGEEVLGSFSSEITLNKIVLKGKQISAD